MTSPSSTEKRARLAVTEHNHRTKDPGADARADGSIRHAVESRNDSFLAAWL